MSTTQNLVYVHANRQRLHPVKMGSSMTIGAAEVCDLQLQGKNARYISRKHAKVSCDENGAFFIKTLSSTNPITVNGAELAKGEPAHELCDGDKIKICTYHLGWLIQYDLVGSKNYRAELIKIWTVHAPEKLKNVDKVLLKYKGKEAEMMAKLKKKYFRRRRRLNKITK